MRTVELAANVLSSMYLRLAELVQGRVLLRNLTPLSAAGAFCGGSTSGQIFQRITSAMIQFLISRDLGMIIETLNG